MIENRPRHRRSDRMRMAHPRMQRRAASERSFQGDCMMQQNLIDAARDIIAADRAGARLVANVI